MLFYFIHPSHGSLLLSPKLLHFIWSAVFAWLIAWLKLHLREYISAMLWQDLREAVILNKALKICFFLKHVTELVLEAQRTKSWERERSKKAKCWGKCFLSSGGLWSEAFGTDFQWELQPAEIFLHPEELWSLQHLKALQHWPQPHTAFMQPFFKKT